MTSFNELAPLSSIVLAESRNLLSLLRRNKKASSLFTAAFRTSSLTTDSYHHTLIDKLKTLRLKTLQQPNQEYQQHGQAQKLPLDGEISRSNGITKGGERSQTFDVYPETVLEMIEPFLYTVKSKDTSGMITGTGLEALSKVTGHLIQLISCSQDGSNRQKFGPYAIVFGEIITAAASCRFDAADPAADDIVLARILLVLSQCVVSECGAELADAILLRAFDTCAAISSGRRRRSSDLLKSAAEQSLIEITSAIALRVKHLEFVDEKLARQIVDTGGVGEVASPSSKGAGGFEGGVDVESGGKGGRGRFDFMELDQLSERGPPTVLCLRIILRIACRMADPATAASVEESALGHALLTAILRGGGKELIGNQGTEAEENERYGSIVQLLGPVLLLEVCPAVVRSVSSFKSSPNVIAAAFATTRMLIEALGSHSTPLICALLEKVFPSYVSGVSSRSSHSSIEALTNRVKKSEMIDSTLREVGLEALCEIVAIPGLLTSTYVIADCELKAPDIVSPLIRLLGFAAFSQKRIEFENMADDDDDETAPQRAAIMSTLCSEALISIVKSLENTLGVGKGMMRDGAAHESEDVVKMVSKTRRRRKRKQDYNTAFEVLAAKSKIGGAAKAIQFFKSQGVWHEIDEDDRANDSSNVVTGNNGNSDDADVRRLVALFRWYPGVDKDRIGEVLGEPDMLSRKVLNSYVASFDFSGRTFTESLRLFMESFRIPGEAQKIDKILECFATQYYNQNTGNMKNSAIAEGENGPSTNKSSSKKFSNSSSSKPTTSESERKRTTDVFASAEAAHVMSFSVVMLNTDQHSLSIKKRMTFEEFARNNRGVNSGKDFPRWFLQQIFYSIRKYEIRTAETAEMSQLTALEWKEIMQSRGSRLPNFDEASLFSKDILQPLWRPCVSASRQLLTDALDENEAQRALEGLLSLVHVASSFDLSEPCNAVVSALTTATGVLEGPLRGVTIRFGKSIKAQMAAVSLLAMTRQYGDWLRSRGWRSIVSFVLRLHILDLLPKSLEQACSPYGPDIMTPDGKTFQASSLIPAWWSIRKYGKESSAETQKVNGMRKANGFLAAFLGVSLGDESESDDESHNLVSSRKVSSSPPSYLVVQDPEDMEAEELARKCIERSNVEEFWVHQVSELSSESVHCLAQSISRAAHKILDGKEASIIGSRSTGGHGSPTASRYGGGTVEDGRDRVERGVHTEDKLAAGERHFATGVVEPQSPRNDSSAVIGLSSVQSRSVGGVESRLTLEVSPQSRRDERKARTLVIAFCIDSLTCLVLLNKNRASQIWPQLITLLTRVLSAKAISVSLLEIAVFSLLRVLSRTLDREELRFDILRSLHLLLRLPEKVWSTLSTAILSGVHQTLKENGKCIQSTSGWHSIFGIIEAAAKHGREASSIGLKCLHLVFDLDFDSGVVAGGDPIASQQTYGPLLDAICAYTASTSVETSIAALDLLSKLADRLRERGTMPLEGFWGPLLRGLGAGAQDPRGKVRNHALKVLERVAAPGGAAEILSAEEWKGAFETVLLPLMKKIFTSDGMLNATAEAERAAQRAMRASTGRRTRDAYFMKAEHDAALMRGVRAACGRTRLLGVGLVSKTILQHHSVMAKGLPDDEFVRVWSDVLEVYQKAWESAAAKAGELREHIPESAKNVILVLASNSILSKENLKLWKVTEDGVRDFLPNLEDLVLSATHPEVVTSTSSSLKPSNSNDKQESEIEENGETVTNSVPNSTNDLDVEAHQEKGGGGEGGETAQGSTQPGSEEQTVATETRNSVESTSTLLDKAEAVVESVT